MNIVIYQSSLHEDSRRSLMSLKEHRHLSVVFLWRCHTVSRITEWASSSRSLPSMKIVDGLSCDWVKHRHLSVILPWRHHMVSHFSQWTSSSISRPFMNTSHGLSCHWVKHRHLSVVLPWWHIWSLMSPSEHRQLSVVLPGRHQTVSPVTQWATSPRGLPSMKTSDGPSCY